MSTKPVFGSKLAKIFDWSKMPVIGKLLSPGTIVMSLIVELPTTPAVAVERSRVTLPMAIVIMEGLGMYAMPLMLGWPGLAPKSRVTLVTLKPARPLSAMLVSYNFDDRRLIKIYSCMCFENGS
jgi:hypothetical protein